MEGDRSWSDWWRSFLGIGPDSYQRAVDILTKRYIEESQHVARFTEHAQRMQYPQFRQQLLEIAADEAKHVELIGGKLKQLGARLPDVPPISAGTKNSWQYLLEDLTEQQRCAEELMDLAQNIRLEAPDIAELIERIYQDGSRHRAVIRDMLMKSDPQSLWPA
jgi:rubrerythrin